jgi:hypothetical protein
MNYNSFEEELDAIRLEIYEKIKDMTYEERAAYIKTETSPLHEEYNIRVVSKIESDSEQHKEYAAS